MVLVLLVTGALAALAATYAKSKLAVKAVVKDQKASDKVLTARLADKDSIKELGAAAIETTASAAVKESEREYKAAIDEFRRNLEDESRRLRGDPDGLAAELRNSVRRARK
jgi:hypothetical protein